MEKFQEQIIDLVDVLVEPEPDQLKGKTATPGLTHKTESPPEIKPNELGALVRKEVERFLKETVDENIQKMIREVLIQEAEKAIAREIEILKRK